MRKEIIGRATLFCGDCRDILSEIRADAVICDPPYGIGEGRKTASRTRAFKSNDRWSGRRGTDYDKESWDDKPLDDETISAIRSSAPIQIIFGGNYYSLPPARCWLIWDKENGNTAYADCEMAWTNLDQAVRLKRYLWSGFRKAKPEERYHSTQKPVAVMQWAIVQAGSPALIFDPVMGSGTTGVAAVNLGLSFIGCEISPKHFDTACKRLEESQRQQQLAL